MFIYSIRATTIRFILLTLALAVLVGGLAIGGAGESISAVSLATEIDYDGVKTKEKRIEFMREFGIEVDEGSEQEQAFRMPDSFDRVIAGYNQLQQRQGLDLSKYRNKRVTRYSYRVTNFKGDGEVMANLFIYRGRIVACDLSSQSPDGFVIPLTQVERQSLK